MTEMTVSSQLALDQSCHCTPLHAWHIDYKPAMTWWAALGITHIPKGANHQVLVMVNVSKPIWGCLQSHMTESLCCTALGLESSISLEHSPISQLAWEASSRQVGLTTRWYVRGINGGDSKDEMPVTNAATAVSKGEASHHTRDPSCYQGAAQSCFQHQCSAPLRGAASLGARSLEQLLWLQAQLPWPGWVQWAA